MGDHPGGQAGWLGTGQMGSVLTRRLLTAAARGHEVPMPVASLVHQIVQSLVGQGFGEQDFAAVRELQARAEGPELVSENAEVTDGLEPVGGTGETSGDAAVSTA